MICHGDISLYSYVIAPNTTPSPSHPYFVGEILEILDTKNKWLIAQICRVEGSRIFIHYEGWSNKVRKTCDDDVMLFCYVM